MSAGLAQAGPVHTGTYLQLALSEITVLPKMSSLRTQARLTRGSPEACVWGKGSALCTSLDHDLGASGGICTRGGGGSCTHHRGPSLCLGAQSQGVPLASPFPALAALTGSFPGGQALALPLGLLSPVLQGKEGDQAGRRSGRTGATQDGRGQAGRGARGTRHLTWGGGAGRGRARSHGPSLPRPAPGAPPGAAQVAAQVRGAGGEGMLRGRRPRRLGRKVGRAGLEATRGRAGCRGCRASAPSQGPAGLTAPSERARGTGFS